MKYKCLLIDDNQIELDAAESFVKKIDQLEIEALCNNPLDAIEIIRKGHIDIVFSDIDMPEIKGIELLRTLKDPPVFVFISSHSEYALEGYELDVADYLLKPVNFPRFLKAVHKAIEVCETRKLVRGKQNPEEQVDISEEHFMIKAEGSYIKIRFSDIDFIESMSNYSKIWTSGERSHTVLVSLKKIEDALPRGSFIRTHRSFIVPVDKIEEVRPAEVRIGKHMIPLGSSFKEALMELVVNRKLLSRNDD